MKIRESDLHRIINRELRGFFSSHSHSSSREGLVLAEGVLGYFPENVSCGSCSSRLQPGERVLKWVDRHTGKAKRGRDSADRFYCSERCAQKKDKNGRDKMKITKKQLREMVREAVLKEMPRKKKKRATPEPYVGGYYTPAAINYRGTLESLNNLITATHNLIGKPWAKRSRTSFITMATDLADNSG